MEKNNIKECLDKFSYGVYIVTSKYENKLAGLTCAWVTQVSFSPLLVAVAIGKTRYTHDIILKSGIFVIHILSEEQIELARHFGLQSGRNIDKFKNIDYELDTTGAPILKNAVGWLKCKVYACYEAGDHTIFVGEILEGKVQCEEKNLLTFRRSDYW